MKQVKKWINPDAADDCATFIYSNNITVLLSWIEDNMFTKKIVLIMAVPKDAVALLELQKTFKN